jgi:hypothetical protein
MGRTQVKSETPAKAKKPWARIRRKERQSFSVGFRCAVSQKPQAADADD